MKSGVARLDVLDCEGGGGTGTGFLISPTLVGTVAHVVDGYRTVRVTSPWTGVVTAGRVVGYSHDRDLALVETAGELPGHVFDLAEDVPEVGTEIAVLGFPLARSMQITTGDINDTHERRVVGNEFELSDMLLTDAAINPGNSGGPWIDRHGMVVALAESGPPYDPGFDDRAQGNNAGVSVRDAAAHFAEWESAQQPLEPCGPAPTPVEEALTTLDIYFSLINESDYESAYAQLDSANHPLAEMDSFVEDVKSTQDHSVGGDPNSWPLFEVLDAYVRGDNVEAEIRFESHQLSEQGPEGQTCTIWHLRYVFSEGNGVQSIHSSSAVDGQPEYEAC